MIERPDGFKLSKNILGKLPEDERTGAAEHLWTKSGGICALCDQPLPHEAGLVEDGEIEPDHHVPEHAGAGGPNELANLYLAHKSCNRKRRDLPFALAHAIIRFATWADRKGRVTFADVLAAYVPEANKTIRFDADHGVARIEFDGVGVSAEIATDPATGTEYFFIEAPIEFIHNDKEVQPRAIEADHVGALAGDFLVRPVHEPSNARLVVGAGSTARLLQFDGQHKTSAQIILGRKTVPLKVYVQPSLPMLQELVISIQQRIKKRPLSTSDTLVKLGDVVAQRLAEYRVPDGEVRTEEGYVASQPLEQRKKVKAEWLQELERLVLFDENDRLLKYVSTKRSTQHPTTDSVVISKLIRPFVHQSLLNEDMDQINGRDHERRAILLILNTIVEKVLEPGWAPGASAILRRRAQNFFYQGSIGWWVTRILMPAILIRLEIPKGDHGRPFLKPLTPEQQDKLRELVEQLAAWDIWSLDESHLAVKAMRSNVAKDVAAALPQYTEFRLIKEVIG